ncbi:MAG: hypothetical protein JWN14_11 [Chthonomonadales bacterium]|nr:hypothetical protein [Chthonomonadales bacterium]
MTNITIEERLTALEAAVQRLKEERTATSSTAEAPWWKRVIGVYKDDPEFLEAMRLGREYRESLRPQSADM